MCILPLLSYSYLYIWRQRNSGMRRLPSVWIGTFWYHFFSTTKKNFFLYNKKLWLKINALPLSCICSFAPYNIIVPAYGILNTKDIIFPVKDVSLFNQIDPLWVGGDYVFTEKEIGGWLKQKIIRTRYQQPYCHEGNKPKVISTNLIKHPWKS